ncbi:MAG TPA: nickel-binding protein [Gaiellaceae bacterium]|jgi:hypothetical protein|nr:nickel-binding protein [Gaiellaceae bacterium]
MPRYLAELYLPRSGSGSLQEAALRARSAADEMTREGTPIRYLRAIFLGEDEVCMHLYEAASPELVREASRRAAIPIERVTEAMDVDLGAAPDSDGRSE